MASCFPQRIRHSVRFASCCGLRCCAYVCHCCYCWCYVLVLLSFEFFLNFCFGVQYAASLIIADTLHICISSAHRSFCHTHTHTRTRTEVFEKSNFIALPHSLLQHSTCAKAFFATNDRLLLQYTTYLWGPNPACLRCSASFCPSMDLCFLRCHLFILRHSFFVFVEIFPASCFAASVAASV